MAKVYALFIVSREGLPLFSKNFDPERVNTDLITSFLTAIRDFVGEISPDATRGLRLIEAHGFSILIEPGDLVFGALMTDREDPLLRECLRILVRQFERQFSDVLPSWSGGDVSVFESFSDPCDRVLSVIALSSYHVPKLGGWAEGDITVPEELWAVMRHIDGRSTVAELAKRAGLSLEETIERVKKLAELGVIEVDVREPVEAVARAYEDILNAFSSDLISLLGQAVATRLIMDALTAWGREWIAHVGDGRLEPRELDRLAWLHTPREVYEMMDGLVELLALRARLLLGSVADALRERATNSLLAKYRDVLVKYEALRGEADVA